jgi:hypothetical protein
MSETPHDTSVLPRLPMTKALRTLIGEISANHPVGLISGPRVKQGDVWVNLPTPYFILYPGWASGHGGPWTAPDADVDWFYQVRCVSEDASQIEWMRDKLMRLFLARNADGGYVQEITVEGMSVMRRWVEDDTGIPEGTGSTLQSDIRFGLAVTPRTAA